MNTSLKNSLLSLGLFLALFGGDAFAITRFAVVCGKDDLDLDTKGINLGCGSNGSIALGYLDSIANNQCLRFDITAVTTPTILPNMVCVTITGNSP